LTGNEYARGQVEQVTGIRITDTDGDGFPDTEDQNRAAFDYMVRYGVPLDETTVIYEAGRVRERLDHDLSGAEEDATVFSVSIPGTREQSVVTAAREALETDLRTLSQVSSISFVGLTGSPFTREASLNATSRALNVALPIAAVLCFLVVLAVMRSMRYAIVTVVPIGLVVAWLYAFMYLAGFALNYVTAIIAAVSVGVGIDYAVHFTQRFREELARAGDKLQAVRQTTQGTGVALVASAASSTVGFIIMSFAPMPVFASYGVLTAVMIGLAAIASLVVLPSLLVMVAREPARP
jgi:predicted RND superfamily exporter protein